MSECEDACVTVCVCVCVNWHMWFIRTKCQVTHQHYEDTWVYEDISVSS